MSSRRPESISSMGPVWSHRRSVSKKRQGSVPSRGAEGRQTHVDSSLRLSTRDRRVSAGRERGDDGRTHPPLNGHPTTPAVRGCLRKWLIVERVLTCKTVERSSWSTFRVVWGGRRGESRFY